jgi:DNA-nicking Smr family endonuclease
LNSKISDKDKKDWEQFLSDNDPLPNKDNNYNNKKTNKTKSIDLHGYSLNGANETIKSFITQAYNEGVKKLIIVTGKGLH